MINDQATSAISSEIPARARRFATQWQNATHPPPDSGVGRWDQLRGGELFLSCKILLPNVLRQKSSPPSPWRGTRLGGQLPPACHANHQGVAKPLQGVESGGCDARCNETCDQSAEMPAEPYRLTWARTARGTRIVKVLPSPSRLVTAMPPPSACTRCLTMLRPRPVPPNSRLRALST